MTFVARELTVRYRDRRRPALDGVTMEVPAGSLYAVLGPNGSGKSTLLRALLGLQEREGGSVFVEGRPLSEWSRRALARHVGVVSQSEALAFPMTARALVAMGRYPHLGPLRAEGPRDQEAIARALERCDVDHLAERPVHTLSGGELQRVRIARALAQEPRALALDEPTNSLDIRHRMTILRLLRRSADQGITVLLITHHLNLAVRFADRILLLDEEGRRAAEGPVEEVVRSPTLERVYRWPLAVDRDPASGALRITPEA